MTIVAVIPARGGSRGIADKNLAMVGGRTLVRRAVEACWRSRSIDHVVVTTDDQRIALEAQRAGAHTVERPAELSGDTASSESALLHAIEQLPAHGLPTPHVVVFVQCTSPFIDPAALDRATTVVSDGTCDVAFAATESHAFIWRWRGDNEGFVGINHEPDVRQRRQDRPLEVAETGAFYAFRRDAFEIHRRRFHGRVWPILVDPLGSIEIDDPRDLTLSCVLAPVVDPPTIHGAIEAVVTDFDGVHTDNRASVDEYGRESVVVSRSDGLGIADLRRAEIPILVLSTEVNPVVSRRAEKLGVDCISGCSDKLGALRQWCDERGVRLEGTVYVGNDHNDAACLKVVGWPVVVADAHPAVRSLARVITAAAGGNGAVREVADLVLAARPRTTTPFSTEYPHATTPSSTARSTNE